MPRVDYKGLIADIREEDLQSGMNFLAACSEAEQKQILASVTASLDCAVHRTLKKHAAFTPQELQNIANDIGIWFAYETLRGRALDYATAAH